MIESAACFEHAVEIWILNIYHTDKSGERSSKAFGDCVWSSACMHTYLNFQSQVPIRKLFRDGVVGNISACHADARGSIPRRGVF